MPPRREADMSFVELRDRVRVSPLRALSLFTVRAAISSARPVEVPRLRWPCLMCSYWRSRLVPFLTPRGGMTHLHRLLRFLFAQYPEPAAANGQQSVERVIRANAAPQIRLRRAGHLEAAARTRVRVPRSRGREDRRSRGPATDRPAGDPACLARGVDLHGCTRSPPGNRTRRRRAQAVSLPRALARAPRPPEVRFDAELRASAARLAAATATGP